MLLKALDPPEYVKPTINVTVSYFNRLNVSYPYIISKLRSNPRLQNRSCIFVQIDLKVYNLLGVIFYA